MPASQQRGRPHEQPAPQPGRQPTRTSTCSSTAKPHPCPPGLGIDEARRLIAPQRTGQVGPVTVTTGQALRVYRIGQLVTGDPAALRLGAHDENSVWVGPADQQPRVPASCAFPPGG